ncbi:amino acid ABC transporter substrate-binding protein [Virgibacillus profundi]|uniref:Amino acid ABC transporter substrate-binding protein n=1 Tax=Virgibacillus profundi TaxID=2024555 RepID=A0A2A2IAM4_9BACI|nr:transporter substrate-binding domain-containing protein [Virgibacillus profundi]PAV28103.1 amino acid ABC transporter substrate-binding protein [Virgibacillus profundi]PXY52408.1 amino acid ABC transporter substrate-binding protein [Virgibacillus profundi]
MKRFKLLFALLVIFAVLSACGESNEDNTSGEVDDSAEKESDAEENTTDERWADIQDAGELVVGTSGTLIAASYYDGEEESEDQLTGYDVEVMREVAKRLDLDVSFEIMGIDSMLPAIQSGRIDVAANDIEPTDKRKEAFNFSDPYKYSYSTMAVRESDNSGIETLEDLEGKKAGGGATTIYSQIAEHFGAEVVTYGNAPNEAYLSDVSNSRTDVVINDYYLTKFGVGAFPDFDLHLHPTLKFHPTEQAVVIPKDADQVTEEINAVLNEMREDGTLTELAIKFYEEDASQKPEGEIEEIEGLDL